MVPSGDRRGDDDAEAPTPLGELFYRGTLIRLSRGGWAGVVRSAHDGREIPFEREHVVVLGGAGGPLELREGMTVGYDVGRTSRGLRVTKLFAVPAGGLTAADPSGT